MNHQIRKPGGKTWLSYSISDLVQKRMFAEATMNQSGVNDETKWNLSHE